MVVLTQTLSKSLMGCVNWIRCSTLTMAQCACRIRPSRPLRTPKSSCAASASCRYLSLLRVRMPTSNSVTRKVQEQPVCRIAELRPNKAISNVTKYAKSQTSFLFLFYLRSGCPLIFISTALSQCAQSRFHRFTAWTCSTCKPLTRAKPSSPVTKLHAAPRLSAHAACNASGVFRCVVTRMSVACVTIAALSSTI